MMLLYFGEPAGGSLVMMSCTRSGWPCAETGPVPTHSMQPRREIEESARVLFMTTYSVDGQQEWSLAKRPEDRLNEPFRCVRCIVPGLQRMPRNPDRPLVGRQELPAGLAFAHVPLQLPALGSGQRPLEVVGCQVFQLRTRDHLGPCADPSYEGSTDSPRTKVVALQTYCFRTGATSILNAARALCNLTFTAPSVVPNARAVSSVLIPSMSRSSKTIR